MAVISSLNQGQGVLSQPESSSAPQNKWMSRSGHTYEKNPSCQPLPKLQFPKTDSSKSFEQLGKTISSISDSDESSFVNSSEDYNPMEQFDSEQDQSPEVNSYGQSHDDDNDLDASSASSSYEWETDSIESESDSIESESDSIESESDSIESESTDEKFDSTGEACSEEEESSASLDSDVGTAHAKPLEKAPADVVEPLPVSAPFMARIEEAKVEESPISMVRKVQNTAKMLRSASSKNLPAEGILARNALEREIGVPSGVLTRLNPIEWEQLKGEWKNFKVSNAIAAVAFLAGVGSGIASLLSPGDRDYHATLISDIVMGASICVGTVASIASSYFKSNVGTIVASQYPLHLFS